jgi:hypothetical protein
MSDMREAIRVVVRPFTDLGSVDCAMGIVARMSDTRISTDDLADLLKETGDAHHAAYEATDGTDPEWAIWYSAHLQTLLGNGLGRPITRSEIVYLLCKAQMAQDADGSQVPWPTYYANLFLSDTER